MSITDHGLHIVSGDSAGGTWIAAFNAERRLLVHRDALCTGPLVQTRDIARWEEHRDNYWRETLAESYHDFFGTPDERCLALDLMANPERLEGDGPIYLWVGSDIGDQLFNLFAINLLSTLGVDSDLIRIVQFEPPAKWTLPCLSMACLAPKDLRVIPTPTQPSRDILENYQSAWAAVTADTPTEIMRFLDRSQNASPHVRHALERLLRRHPQLDSGLPLFDEWLLKSVAKHGPATARVIGETLCDIWVAGDNCGDSTLYKRLLRMASRDLPRPLVEIHGPTQLYRDTSVALTDFGKAVVEGGACSWSTNPIDDWIGGVRISADAPPQWMVSREGTLRRLSDLDA
ncbi:MAG: DUF1835 domain-containing protein [Candidatus Hydrogenedentes bacterium]|nr:DUF1835 domain-containing protein [Candidatus Hydrogenedentota bacterium]